LCVIHWDIPNNCKAWTKSTMVMLVQVKNQ
jgi:hypothetical protein